MADYKRYHFNEILSKPFRVEELTEKIQKVLKDQRPNLSGA
jgi:hypothetical protein